MGDVTGGDIATGEDGWKRMQEGSSGTLTWRARSVGILKFLLKTFLLIIYIVYSFPDIDVISM